MDRTGLYEGERAEICANVLVALAEEKLEDTPITDQQRVRLYELYNAARMPGFAKEELDSIRWKKFDTAFEAIREWIDDEKGKVSFQSAALFGDVLLMTILSRLLFLCRKRQRWKR